MELQYTLQVVLLEIVCIGILLFNWQTIFNNYNHDNKRYVLLWLFLTCFCTWFSSGLDYVSYQEALDTNSHVEPFYTSLYKFVGGNYVLWRMVVWGLANVFTVLTIKKMDCNVRFFTVIFILLPLIAFYYVTRNVLGLSIIFYALASFNYKKIWSWLCVAIALAITPAFHNSMMMFGAMLLIALFVPFNRCTFLISLVLFPILQPIVLTLSEDVLLAIDFEELAGTGLNYIEEDNEKLVYTKMGLLDLVLQIVPMSLIIIYSIYKYLIRRNEELSTIGRRFLFMTYMLIYISCLYIGQASVFLSTRFWDTAYIPAAFFISNTIVEHRTKFVVRVFFVLVLLHFAMDLWTSIRTIS